MIFFANKKWNPQVNIKLNGPFSLLCRLDLSYSTELPPAKSHSTAPYRNVILREAKKNMHELIADVQFFLRSWRHYSNYIFLKPRCQMDSASKGNLIKFQFRQVAYILHERYSKYMHTDWAAVRYAIAQGKWWGWEDVFFLRAICCLLGKSSFADAIFAWDKKWNGYPVEMWFQFVWHWNFRDG